MTRDDMMRTLEIEAKSYRRVALDSVRKHPGTSLTAADTHKILSDLNFAKRFADAILTDFITSVGRGQGLKWDPKPRHPCPRK